MLNIRCAFCQTPYTLSHVTMLDALQEVDAHNLTHYNAQCPRCRRATRIPRQRLEMAMPNWRNELKEFETEMKEHPQQEAPLPAPEAAAAAAAEPAPAPKAAKEKPAAKAQVEKPAPKAKAPAAKSTATSSPKGKKPAATRKTTAKKRK